MGKSCFGKEGTGSAHGMGEGGSVCLARPVLGEGVSVYGAGGCGVENRRQGGV